MSRVNLVFLLTFVSLLVWVSFFQAEKVSRIQKGTLRLFVPFIKSSGEIADSVSRLENEKFSYAKMTEALASAQQERDRLRLEVLQLDEILHENNELREALQYKKRSPLNLLPSRVVSRKPLTWYNTMTIDRGAEDGIRPDLPVIVPAESGAALVGKISEVVGPELSIVLLLTDEMCLVPAQTSVTEEQGILKGDRGQSRNQLRFRLRYLSKEANIKPGDVIVSSGIGEVFPKNLLLGQVEEAKKGVIDTEAIVVPLRPYVEFDKLKDVFVIMPDHVDLNPALQTETAPGKNGTQTSVHR